MLGDDMSSLVLSRYAGSDYDQPESGFLYRLQLYQSAPESLVGGHGDPVPRRHIRDPIHVTVTRFDAKHAAISNRVQVHFPQQTDGSRTVGLVYVEGGTRHAARLDSS